MTEATVMDAPDTTTVWPPGATIAVVPAFWNALSTFRRPLP
jgi:hypothetical protein